MDRHIFLVFYTSSWGSQAKTTGVICNSLLQFLDANSWIVGKDPDAGKDWGQEEKGTAVDEMVGWHHQFDGHELGQPLGDSEEVLQSMRSQRVRHDLATEQQQSKTSDIIVTSLYIWRRQWRPTLVLLPRKSHGWRSLVGCSPWGH